MPVLFLSDLHLCPQRPEKISLFARLMQEAPGRISAMYILGDLFEFLCGDGDFREPVPMVFAAIAKAVDSGLPVYFMNGNREFLVGHGISARSGMALLPDPFVLQLDGLRTVLSHGDMLCTADRAYMRFRRLVGSAPVQCLAKLLPQGALHLLSDRHRQTADADRSPEYAVDVEPMAVEGLLRDYGAQVMVHGHTHAPGMHAHRVDDRATVRYVLGDWILGDTVLQYGDGNFSYHRAPQWIDGGLGG